MMMPPIVQGIWDKLVVVVGKFFDLYNTSGDYVYWFYLTYSRAILDFLHSLFDNSFKVLIYSTALLATFYLVMAFFIVLRRKRNGTVTDYFPKVTIQIPTFNETAAINCAKKCLDFDYPKKQMEIIIGDDSSDSTVSKKIDEFASKHELVKVTRRGSNDGYKPANLNYMLERSDGEFLVIFDSDFLPGRDFLRRIIAPFKDDENLSVVQARWKASNFNQNIISILGGTISLICHYISLSFINLIKGNTFLCGSAEAIRKKHLLEVGGWKQGSLTEDIECSMRLIKNGKKLKYLEDLECKCEVPFTFKDLCKQQMRWAYGVISSMKIHLRSLLTSRRVSLKDKLSVLVFISGYMFSFLLLSITVLGMLSVISNRQAPVDWARFFSETGANILMTSGFLISSIVALFLSKRVRQLPKVVMASLSVGLIVTYYVNVGIMKAFFDRKMKWFMLKKNGNEW